MFQANPELVVLRLLPQFTIPVYIIEVVPTLTTILVTSGFPTKSYVQLMIKLQFFGDGAENATNTNSTEAVMAMILRMV